MSESAEEERVQHRPLPSVGIPLLRDELRASRIRRAVGGGVLVALVLGGAASAVLVPSWLDRDTPADEEARLDDEVAPPTELAAHPGEGLPEVPEAIPEPEPVPEPLPDGDGTRTTQRFGDARGFRPGLVSAGCTGEEADALITALTGVLDFRRCRPEHEVSLDRDGEGVLRRFEYRASITHVYEARRDDEGAWTAHRVEIPVERVRIRRGGTIQASLGGALEAAGLGRSLVGTFVETFEREVNFNTDTRAGDTFRIIVDEERIAGDLQRYGRVHAIDVRGERLGHRRAFYFAPRDDLADFYDETGRAVHGGWLRTPLHYDHISSPFDPRRMHPVLRRIHPHNGVDYAAGTGTPVWAAAEGTVTFVGPRGANGNLVSLRHANGYESHYAHLSRFASGLSRGDSVTQRQVIGYVGSTGRSTGPHLHFGLKRNGRFVDPQAELNGPGRMMPAAFLGRYRALVRQLRTELEAIPVAGSSAAAPTPASADGDEEPASD